jgi:hypothetical protein
LENQGAVILHSFGTDGKFQSDTLSRLPEDVTKYVDVSLLHSSPEASSNQVRLVLNKAPQREYMAKDISNNILPIVIDRTKESIPTFVTTIHLPLGGAGAANIHERQRDLPWRSESRA